MLKDILKIMQQKNNYFCEWCGCKLKYENAYQPDITKQKFLCKDCWQEGNFRFDIFDGW